ncbi:hypothetical protein ILYODFUR_036128 [Ilyodon furcidens]|uniref:Uncharacterized protein n=1 Tax=Ilyodon furcidens TaxID=33524 RepID=A0ABV0VCE2_9TELE
MCGDGVGAAALGRDEDPLLCGRPAFAGSVQRGSSGADKESGRTSDSSGVFYKLVKKFCFPIPDDRLSGGGVKLSHNESPDLSAENRRAVSASPPCPTSQRSDSSVTNGITGNDVSGSRGCSAGSASYETSSEMVHLPAHRSCASEEADDLSPSFYHSVIRIKVGSFPALVCRGRRGAFFMSIRLRDVIPPAADEQKFSFQHH